MNMGTLRTIKIKLSFPDSRFKPHISSEKFRAGQCQRIKIFDSQRRQKKTNMVRFVLSILAISFARTCELVMMHTGDRSKMLLKFETGEITLSKRVSLVWST